MKKNLLILLIGLVSLVAIVVSVLTYNNTKKIVVIDVLRTLNEFQLKKDLEKKAEPKLLGLKNRADSLYAMVEYAVNNNTANAEALSKEYKFWHGKALEAYETSNTAINQQVWDRLNPLIDAYGKKNNMRIVIGANGMGTVLYNDEIVDATSDLIKFINTQYVHGEK